MSSESRPEVPTFTLLWNNKKDTLDRSMNHHRFQIRDLLPGDQDNTLWDIHLDQMIVTFRPPNQLPSTIYQSPDNVNTDYEATTWECLIAFSPCGAKHTLYVEDQTTSNLGPDAWNLVTPLRYSVALSAAPMMDKINLPLAQSGTSMGLYNRVYRPIRDAAIAHGLPMVQGCMPPISLELMWPQLQGQDRSVVPVAVPDYRIQQVLCNFSCRRR